MKAVLVAIQLTGTEEAELKSSLEELTRLVETLGFEVIGTLTQRRKSPAPGSVLGSGKLKELALWTGGTGIIPSHRKTTGKNAEKENKDEQEDEIPPEVRNAIPLGKATKVIFDQDLTPNQLKHLEQATGVEVLDRTSVIVEIFHRHAKTREAQLQVEIARLNYMAPRVRATGTGERHGGGMGSKGAGETSYELDKRRIRDRIAELSKELASIGSDDSHRRERRSDQLRIALVGYTNAGKSSLMRALTGDEVYIANKLFATLDTTVRAMQPDIFPRILVSDTVGFIKKLPHDLVASFRSTLDEAKEASLLLYVVDASDPAFRSQLEVTRTVLSEIGASKNPSLLILNKSDCLDIAQIHLLKREFPEAHLISTREPKDILNISKIIRELLTHNLTESSILVPYDDKNSMVGEIRRSAAVLSETYEEKGILFKIKTYPEVFTRLKKILPQ